MRGCWTSRWISLILRRGKVWELYHWNITLVPPPQGLHHSPLPLLPRRKMEGETDGLKHSPKKSILCKYGRFPLKARTNKGPATWFGVPALFRLHWERNSNPPSLSQTGWPDDARLTGHWAVPHPTSPAKQPSPNSIKLWATDLQKSITRAKFNHSVQVLLGTFTVSYTSVKILCTANGWSILLVQEEASSPRGACSLSNSTSPREWHRHPWTKVFFGKGKQI